MYLQNGDLSYNEVGFSLRFDICVLETIYSVNAISRSLGIVCERMGIIRIVFLFC